MSIAAVDVGFGRVKAVNESQRIDFPAVVGDFTKVDYASGMQQRSRTEQIVEYNGERFFTGELARRQSTPRATLDSSRIVNKEGLTLLFSALTALMPAGVQELNLVVGLPVSDYSVLKEKYRQALVGPHRVRTLDLEGRQDKEHLFKIQGVKVLPQPFGSLFSRLLNDKGEIAAREYGTSSTGIIDIGFHTLDLCRADRLEFVGRESTSFKDLGLSLAFVELSREIYKIYQVEVPLENVEVLLRSGYIKISGRQQSLSEIKKQPFRRAAEKIISRVSSSWPRRWQLDKVIITGGGAAFLGDELAAALGHHEVEVCKQQGIYTNVEGYYKYGVRTWGR